MSNPLAIFRKNRTYWMAALVLLAILAFVVAPAIETASRALRGGSDSDQVVVRWDGGRVTVRDLRITQARHGGLVRFLESLARTVLERGGQPRVPGFSYDPEQNQITGLGIQGSSDEMSICRTKILAAHAKRLGVRFSDETADLFLEEFCDGKITSNELRTTLNEATSGQLSNFDIREMLKTELSAMVVSQFARSGLFSIPPGETWANFLKLNQTASVEAFPVYVDDFISEVTGEPTEAELQAIYDAGASVPANNPAGRPGFLRTYQADIEHVEASMPQWIEREKAKLTEEQLREEYERRIELNQLQVPVEPSDDSSADQAGLPLLNPPAEGLPPAPGSGDSQQSSDEATEAESPDGDDGDAEEGTSEPTPEDEPSGDGEDAATDQSEPQENGPEEDDTALNTDYQTTSRVRLVAAWQENDNRPPPVVQPSAPALNQEANRKDDGDADQGTDATAEGQASGDQDSEAESGEDSATEEAETQATPPSEPDQQDASPEAPIVVGQPGVPAAGGDAGLNLQGPGGTGQSQEAPEMRTQTFEEAREQLAEELAQDAAFTGISEAFAKLRQEVMMPYYNEYRQYQAMQRSEASTDVPERPEPPDLEQAAEEYGLNYTRTGLVDAQQIADTPFGQSNIRGDETGLQGPVRQIAFSRQLALFAPQQSNYFDQAAMMSGSMEGFRQFVFWKIDERPAYIPEIDEVRQEVVEAWRRSQALELARQAAAELAQQVNETSENPWQSALSTAEQSLLVETGDFSWMRRTGEFAQPGDVPELEAVGETFMQAVFSSEVGEAGSAPNQREDQVYVFRVTDLTPSVEELQQRFNADPMKSGPMNLANMDRRNSLMSWYENLEAEMGVEWQMAPAAFN